MSDESRRKLQRKTFDRIISVYDVMNAQAFGELVNLTSEGLMVMTRQPVPKQAVYQLALQLPEPIDGGDRIPLGVDCLWSRQGDDYHRHWSGFAIIDIAADDLGRLQTLLDEHGH